MPVTVMVAILCEVVLILMNCFLIAAIVIAVMAISALGIDNVTHNVRAAVALMGVLRIVVELALIRGFVHRNSSSRWLATGLSFVGLLFFGCVFIGYRNPIQVL